MRAKIGRAMANLYFFFPSPEGVNYDCDIDTRPQNTINSDAVDSRFFYHLEWR